VSAFIEERKLDFGVEPICRTLGVSASAYYQRATGDRSARAIEDERLVPEIRRVHEANYEAYGYRRTWLQMRREGEQGPRCQVQRLMRREGIRGAKRRGHPARTTVPDPRAVARPDLLERDFTATRPNSRWVADFTYLRCWEGLAFFSFILDVHSRYLCGWQFASNMRADLVEDALQMAVAARNPDPLLELVHHSEAVAQTQRRRVRAWIFGRDALDLGLAASPAARPALRLAGPWSARAPLGAGEGPQGSG
jgi:putative transposase